MIQEMLLLRTQVTDTTGKYIFNTVKNYFKEYNIPLENIIYVVTDKTLTVNKICINDFNDRLLRHLYKDNEEEFNH